MPPAFDADAYTSVPTRSPGPTLSLARGLLAAAPARRPRAIAKRLAVLREQAALLQAAWIDVNRPAPSVQDLRPFDVVIDRRWGALRSRLEGCVQLEDDDESPRAQVLMSALFPTGLDFLKLPYAEEWAQSERRLVLIETDGLAAELEALVGKKYLPALKKAHAAYGTALGITDKKDATPEATRVIEPLRALQAAIASYARGVVGHVDELDEKEVAAARAQLEPILRARRPRAAGEEEEPIEAPLPELPESVE